MGNPRPRPRTAGPTQPAAASDGTIAAYGNDQVTLWQLARLPYLLGPTDLTALTFTPDELAAASFGPQSEPMLVAWPRNRPDPPRPTAQGATYDVHLDAFTPDGTGMAITAGYTTTIKDVWTGAVTTTLVPDQKYMPSLKRGSPLSAREFSRDGSLLATNTPGFGLVWDVRKREVRNTYDASGLWCSRRATPGSRCTGPTATSGCRTSARTSRVTRADGHRPPRAPRVRRRRPADGRGGQRRGPLPQRGRPHGNRWPASTSGPDVGDGTEPGRHAARDRGRGPQAEHLGRQDQGAVGERAGTTGAQTRLAWNGNSELAVSDTDGVTVWPISPDVAIANACILLERGFAAVPENC